MDQVRILELILKEQSSLAESMVLLIAVPESGKQCDHPNKLVTGSHIVTLTTSAMHLLKLIDRKTSNEVVNKSDL